MAFSIQVNASEITLQNIKHLPKYSWSSDLEAELNLAYPNLEGFSFELIPSKKVMARKVHPYEKTKSVSFHRSPMRHEITTKTIHDRPRLLLKDKNGEILKAWIITENSPIEVRIK